MRNSVDKDLMKTISNNLKRLRKNSGLSARGVAEALGVPQSDYANSEYGMRMPSLSLLCKISDFYGVTVDEILGRDSLENMLIERYGLNAVESSVVETVLNLPPDKRKQIIAKIAGSDVI